LALFLGGVTYIVYVVANAISVSDEENQNLHFAIMIPCAALLGVITFSFLSLFFMIHEI